MSHLRVKVVSYLPTTLRRQLPDGVPQWGDCEFVFDREATEYDWLVVYDDLPARLGERKKISIEQLACPREHTLLVTTEPSSVKHYGNDYTHQFGAVLTSQEEWALPHPRRIFSQPALHWFYGVGQQALMSFDSLLNEPSGAKSSQVSMVYSPKAMRHTLHYRRAQFMQALARGLPELDLYGRQTARPLDDKADCLRGYRYHVAIENYIGTHHWTEKLADPYLGLALPFYAGCPNADSYFPSDSFIHIDLNDPDGAVDLIRSSMASNEYEKRLPALQEARRRVLYDYNFFAVVAREIAQIHRSGMRVSAGEMIASRRALRLSNPGIVLRDMAGKMRARLHHLPETWRKC